VKESYEDLETLVYVLTRKRVGGFIKTGPLFWAAGGMAVVVIY